MDDLTSAEGIAALAAGAVALIALILAVVLAFRLRRVRVAQTAVLGGGDRGDLVSHAETIGRGFTELRDWVEETFERLDARMSAGEQRIDGCLTYRSLVRYDAYGEMSGRQSSSVALLDECRSGIVVTSISHRDSARLYVKQIHEGASELELSPEEQEAVDTALSAGRV